MICGLAIDVAWLFIGSGLDSCEVSELTEPCELMVKNGERLFRDDEEDVLSDCEALLNLFELRINDSGCSVWLFVLFII